MINLIFAFLSLSNNEVWSIQKPYKSSHIRVSRGLYYHHGIYVSDDEVIHFSAIDNDGIINWNKCNVISSSLKEFLQNGTLEVKKYNKFEKKYLKSDEYIVSYARSCIGKKGYNLLINNCEHFVNTCTIGKSKSIQIENILYQKLSLISKTNVFYPFINFAIGKGSIMGFFLILACITSNLLNNKNSKNYTSRKKAVEKKSRYMPKTNIIKKLEKVSVNDIQDVNKITNTILKIQDKDEIINKNIIFNNKNADIIRQLESFYNDLINKINEENEKYLNENLKKMLDTLQTYEENSCAYKIYRQAIKDDLSSRFNYMQKYMDNLIERQDKIINLFSSENYDNKKFNKLIENRYYKVSN